MRSGLQLAAMGAIPYLATTGIRRAVSPCWGVPLLTASAAPIIVSYMNKKVKIYSNMIYPLWLLFLFVISFMLPKRK